GFRGVRHGRRRAVGRGRQPRDDVRCRGPCDGSRTMTILTIARLELTAAIRLKWLRLLTASFVLLAAASAYAAGAAEELTGADSFARTTTTLVPMVLILAPLAAIVLGVSGQSAEPEGEPFLLALPIGRAAVLVGRWLGEAAALAIAVAGGLGAGGVVVALGS